MRKLTFCQSSFNKQRHCHPDTCDEELCTSTNHIQQEAADDRYDQCIAVDTNIDLILCNCIRDADRIEYGIDVVPVVSFSKTTLVQ